MPQQSEISVSRRPSHITAIAGVVKEAQAIARWGGPAIVRRLPVETAEWMPRGKREQARAEKEARGREALAIFHDHLYSQPDDTNHERYKAIFGEPSTDGNRPYGEVSFLGKGWNTFALKFHTENGDWVIKVGYLNSPNPLFFANPSHPTHAAEMRQNLKNIKEAADAAGIPNFVAFPQEVAHLTLPQYQDGQGDHGVTLHVMPYVKSVSKRELRSLLQDPQTREHLIEEKRAIDSIRKTLQHDAQSDFDLTGDGNVAIVWKKDDQGKEYPGFQIIDTGLRIYGLNTPLTDLFFDITGLRRGYKLRRQVPTGDEIPGRMEDFHAEWQLMRSGRRARWEIRRDLLGERVNHTLESWGFRRDRRDKAA